MKSTIGILSAIALSVLLCFSCSTSTPSSAPPDASTDDGGGGFCRSCDFVVGSPMGFADPGMCPKNTCPTPPNGNPKSCMLWCCVQSPSAAPFAYPCDLSDAGADAATNADASTDAARTDADAALD